MVGICSTQTSLLPYLPETITWLSNSVPSKSYSFIPSVVLGELYYGARNSSRVAENVVRIERLSSVGTILGIDAGTASRYGEIKHALKQQGTPIPENDIWIAALAMQYELILATQDKHFDNIAQLTREAW